MDFLLIFLAAGMIRVCYQMQNTIVPLYGGQLGYSASMIGLTTTVCTIASLLLRPLLGGMLDKYGRRGIVLVGTALFAVATWLCGMTGAFAVLLALRAMQGLGFSAHTTAVNTMATDVLPEDRMAEGIGYMGLTGSVSTALAPAVALALIAGGQYTRGFTGAFLAGAVAVACLLLVKAPDVKGSSAAQNVPPVKGWEHFWEKGAVKPTLIMLILAVCGAGLGTFLATYALGKGFTSGQVSVYFTVNAIATAAARMFGNRITQRIGEKRGMLIATILCMITFVLIPLSTNPIGLWLAAGLHGLGYGTMYPMLNAMAVTGAPAHRRGTAMSTFLTGMDIGAGFGAGFWGVIIDAIGMDMMFYICAVASLAVYAAYRLLMTKPGASNGKEYAA